MCDNTFSCIMHTIHNDINVYDTSKVGHKSLK